VSTSTHLQRALAAVEVEDFAAARDALVEAWRLRRAPALAVLVELLDRKAPDALTAALAALVTPRVVTSHANLRALAEVDDPRLGRFAIDALVDLPFTATTARDFLLDLADTVDRLDDPRIAEREPAIRAAIATRINRLAVRTRLLERVAAIAARVPEVRPSTTAEAALERALHARLEPLRKSTRSAETLLADIYANPTDDAPRLVYADLLLEHGDPRGELIMLQLDRGDGEPTAREQELLKKHGKAWLGALAPALSWGRGYAGTRFRRGFVAVADIILSVGKKLEPIRTDPAWSTVEELDGSWDHELLLTAPLRALREIDRALGAEAITPLARHPLPRVTAIRITDPHLDPEALRAAFPALTTVRIYHRSEGARDLEALGRLGVEHVAITHNWVEADVRRARDEHARYVDALIGSHAPMARLSLDTPYLRGDRPPPVELRRGADGRFERVVT